MLDSIARQILDIGIPIYLIASVIGFTIFSNYLSLFSKKTYKFANWGGLLLLLTFVIIEYFSKTQIHLVTDILMDLKTGHLNFSTEKFLIILFLSCIVSSIFWRATLISITIAFMLSFGFPQESLDIGFIIFIVFAGYQVFGLTKKRTRIRQYNKNSFITFEKFLTIFITLLTIWIKLLKIFSFYH